MPRDQEGTMTRRTCRTHSPAFKVKVALVELAQQFDRSSEPDHDVADATAGGGSRGFRPRQLGVAGDAGRGREGFARQIKASHLVALWKSGVNGYRTAYAQGNDRIVQMAS